MEQRIHISFKVADLDKTVDFYQRFLGSEPTKKRSDYASFRLAQPPLHLSLTTGAGAASGGGHFGVELFDDGELAAWRSRVESAGLTPRIEDKITCCYAVSDKFWVADPEGREWEVWVRQAEAETMTDAPAVAATAGDAEAAACGPDTGCC